MVKSEIAQSGWKLCCLRTITSQSEVFCGLSIIMLGFRGVFVGFSFVMVGLYSAT